MDFFQSTADQLDTSKTRSRNGQITLILDAFWTYLHRIGETLPFPLH
nr:MAG TPA: hypothetical protein [Caudoviricetes sp.]